MTATPATRRVVVLTDTSLTAGPPVAVAHALVADYGGDLDVTLVGPCAGATESRDDGCLVVPLQVPPPAAPGGSGGAWRRRWRSLRHRVGHALLDPTAAGRRWRRDRRRTARFVEVAAERLTALPADEVLVTRPALAAAAPGRTVRVIARTTTAMPQPPAPAAAVGAAVAPVLGIGPANMAGQAWAWAAAARRAWPDLRTEVFAVQRGRLPYPADVALPAEGWARDIRWQVEWALHVETDLTHVLAEAGRPVLGTLNGRDFRADVAALRGLGKRVALVFHGSDVRDPRSHAARYPWSPFRDPRDPLTRRLQGQVDRLHAALRDYDGQVFVSTPDLLDDLPDATWLPVVIDLERWTPGDTPMQRAVPVVVHAPSNRALKGTALVEPVLRQLTAERLIDYRRIEDVAPEQVPVLVRDADVVLDHFGIGNYGVLTCEAMAAGRVVVSHVHERVRQRVPEGLPVIEATPATLRQVLEGLLRDRDSAREVAAAGPAFVRARHDGRVSASALSSFLD